MRTLILRNTAPVLVALLALPVASRADELAELRAQLRALEQKILVLERKQELKDEAAKAAPKPAAVTATDGRVEITSGDGGTSLRLRALLQTDFRAYDAANDPADSFLVRRARLNFEGRFNQVFSYVIQSELAGTVQVLDANIAVAVAPGFNVRLGKFKSPLGLEQLQSDPVAFFNERSIATNLVPVRDVGLAFSGDVLDQRLNYTVAILNGVPDGASNTTGGTDFDGDKVTVARVFATPFANDKESALAGLGFGFAVSSGNFGTAAGRTAGYRTDGQQTFFAYDSSVVAAGRGLTWTPQAYFYRGPFGVLAEYIASSIEVQRGASPVQQVENYGYSLSFGYVLTGESSSFRGLTPKTVFNPGAGTWGAFEVVARVAGVDVDDAAFSGAATTRLANPNTSATKLTAYGVGLNWYLSRSVRANFDLFRNRFELAPGAAPAASALISDQETSFISRLQVSF